MTGDEFIDDLADVSDAGDVVAALAETVAAPPPRGLRSGVLDAVRQRPKQTTDPVSPAELYASRVDALDVLLNELTGGDWTQPALPYSWSVLGLMAHLTVIEEYTAQQLGLTADAPMPLHASSATEHLRLGASTVASLEHDGPSATLTRWRAAAARIKEHVMSEAFDPASATPLHAWAFDAATALVARAFEIWTHADDIRRATGRPRDVPSAADLRSMSSTSVNGLPILLAVTNGPPMQPTRVVLTGPGGGTFDLGSAGTSVARNLLVADVVDYCRLVARRVAPSVLEQHREGDAALLDGLLVAASAIAV